MTDATRCAIELARRIVGGEAISPADLYHDFARAIVELARPNKVDQERVDRADWQRASGDVECAHCGHVYYDHPTVVGFEWLHRTCSGKLYKL